MDDITICMVPKNSTFDVRIVVEDEEGALQPTGKGVAIKSAALPTLIGSLQRAHAQA
jgi:hypothetical protein